MFGKKHGGSQLFRAAWDHWYLQRMETADSAVSKIRQNPSEKHTYFKFNTHFLFGVLFF
jgi:hypothetical protein